MKGARLIRRRLARRMALEVCHEFGIKATRVNRQWLDDLEEHTRTYLKSLAIASVRDHRKTIGGGQ